MKKNVLPSLLNMKTFLSPKTLGDLLNLDRKKASSTLGALDQKFLQLSQECKQLKEDLEQAERLTALAQAQAASEKDLKNIMFEELRAHKLLNARLKERLERANKLIEVMLADDSTPIV